MDENEDKVIMCPYAKRTPILTPEIVAKIKSTVVPLCFHCGCPYVKDEKYSTDFYSTWKPQCYCVAKYTIRIVTGVSEDEFEPVFP